MTFLKQNWIKVSLGIVILGAILVVFLEASSFTKAKIISTFFKKDCSRLIPQNPYPQGDSEYIGFEWSMLDRGSKNCEAYNQPFVAGCIEYIKQAISYNQCLNNQVEVEKYKAVRPIHLKCEEGDVVSEYCFSNWGKI